MFNISTLLSTYLIIVALSTCVSGQEIKIKNEGKRDLEAFQKLLDQVDEPSLHEALHSFSPKKFKHGAFREDRTAVEVIHQEEPSVATSIVELAKRQKSEVIDLSKRQEISNGTTPSNTPPPVNPSTTSRPTPVPLGSSSTPAPGQTTQSSINPAPSASTSSPVSAGTSVPSSVASSSAAAVTSSIASITSSTPSTTSGSNTYTTGQVITTTNGVGLTIISTIGGGASTISPSKTGVTSTDTHKSSAPTSVVVQTSTLPNGSKSVVTAVTVVGAGASGAGDTPSGTAGVGPTSASASPGLQTGEAIMTRGWGKELVLVVGGAVAFAGMM